MSARTCAGRANTSTVQKGNFVCGVREIALLCAGKENTNVPRLNSSDDSNQKYSSRFLVSSDYLSVNHWKDSEVKMTRLMV